MRTIVTFGFLAASFSAGLPALAQSIDHRSSLGLELPIIAVRHTSYDAPTLGANGQMATTSVGSTTIDMGFFPAGGLNGMYGLGTKSVLGLRLALSRHTESVGGGATAAKSQISLMPRLEYYAAPEKPVRPHIGIEAGYERATANTGLTMNEWLIGPTGGVTYFPSPDWSLDFNASLFLVAGSQSIAGAGTSNGGYGFLLRVDLSRWFGGNSPASGVGSESTSVSNNPAAVPQPASAAPANAPGSATELPATSGAAATSFAGVTAAPAPAAAPPAEGSRLSVDLHEGRSLLLVSINTPGADKWVKFSLMKTPSDDRLAACNTAGLHAPKQGTSTIAVQYKLVPGPSGGVSTLSSEIPADSLKPLIAAPPEKKALATPDHWLELCGQNWPLGEGERRQLKDYLNGL